MFSRSSSSPSSRSNTTTATITLLDKQYQINCEQDEREELLESARLLNQKLSEVRDAGSVIGLERIAMMAALNLAHELVKAQKNSQADSHISSGIDRLQDKISSAIQSMNSQNTL